MAEPADLDEIVRHIRAELRAGGTLPRASGDAERVDEDDALRRIRGNGGGEGAIGRFLAGLLGPILAALAVAGLMKLLG